MSPFPSLILASFYFYSINPSLTMLVPFTFISLLLSYHGAIPYSAPSRTFFRSYSVDLTLFRVLTYPAQAPSSGYIGDSAHNLNGNPSQSQVTGPIQSEELYKRSVMLVIWYKASWSTSCQFRLTLTYGHTASYHTSPSLAPSAHFPVPSTISFSFPPLIALPNPEFFH